MVTLQSALALHQTGNLAGAEKEYRALLQENPNNAQALEKLALICLQTNRVQESVALFASALRFDSKNLDIYLNLATAHKALGHLKECIANNRKAIELGCVYPEAYLNFGDAMLASGDAKASIDLYKKAIELRPEYAEAHNSLGVAQLTLGDPIEASPWLEKAARLKPDFAIAHHNLGNAYQQVGRFEDAVSSYKKAIELGRYPESYLALGLSFLDIHHRSGGKESLDSCIDAFQNAVAARPDYAEAENNLGIALRQDGRLDEAVAVYKKLIERAPAYEAYQNLGLILEKQSHLDEAIANYQRAFDSLCRKSAPDSVAKRVGKLLLELKRIPVLYNTESEIQSCRNAYTRALNEATQLVAAKQSPFEEIEFVALRGLLFTISNFYLAYQQHNDIDLQTTYSELATAILRLEVAPYLKDLPIRKLDQKIRIGVASEYLQGHNGAYWAYGWLANLPKDDYEIFSYSLNGKTDHVTRQFASVSTFRWLPFS